MSEEGAEAYYCAWRVVGAILGCDEEAVPPDLLAARTSSDRYMTRHMGRSPEGAPDVAAALRGGRPGTLFDPWSRR
jgi:ER-bound oxygenase mpaB/B'/Rubber oxygenase, catalytic domain